MESVYSECGPSVRVLYGHPRASAHQQLSGIPSYRTLRSPHSLVHTRHSRVLNQMRVVCTPPHASTHTKAVSVSVPHSVASHALQRATASVPKELALSMGSTVRSDHRKT